MTTKNKYSFSIFLFSCVLSCFVSLSTVKYMEYKKVRAEELASQRRFHCELIAVWLGYAGSMGSYEEAFDTGEGVESGCLVSPLWAKDKVFLKAIPGDPTMSQLQNTTFVVSQAVEKNNPKAVK